MKGKIESKFRIHLEFHGFAEHNIYQSIAGRSKTTISEKFKLNRKQGHRDKFQICESRTWAIKKETLGNPDCEATYE